MLTKAEFDEFFFPAVVNGRTDPAALDTTVAVLRKIKDPVCTEAEPIDAATQEKARKNGQRVYAMNKLREEEWTFSFEDAEHRLVCDRLTEYLPNIHGLALEDYVAMRKKVMEAVAE